MAELMIIVLGFCGVLSGLEKLSVLDLRNNARITALSMAALLQTAGSTLAIICTATQDYTLPMVMLLAGLVFWALADRRGLKRSKEGVSYGR